MALGGCVVQHMDQWTDRQVGDATALAPHLIAGELSRAYGLADLRIPWLPDSEAAKFCAVGRPGPGQAVKVVRS
jgi:hypothetical protein